jgi:hypothetical protein
LVYFFVLLGCHHLIQDAAYFKWLNEQTWRRYNDIERKARDDERTVRYVCMLPKFCAFRSLILSVVLLLYVSDLTATREIKKMRISIMMRGRVYRGMPGY